MFVSILDAPAEIEVAENSEGLGWMVDVPLAMCSDTQRVTSVVSRLVPTEHDGKRCWEFSFEILVVSVDEAEAPFATQERDIAAGYIPADVRARVMGIVCKSLRKLLEHVKPDALYRVTKTRGPSEKALRKHHLLTETCKECGYDVAQRGTDAANRLFWMMVRTS